MNTSEPPRKTIARNPSHFGSYRNVPAAGSFSASLASMGSIGGAMANAGSLRCRASSGVLGRVLDRSLIEAMGLSGARPSLLIRHRRDALRSATPNEGAITTEPLLVTGCGIELFNPLSLVKRCNVDSASQPGPPCRNHRRLHRRDMARRNRRYGRLRRPSAGTSASCLERSKDLSESCWLRCSMGESITCSPIQAAC